MQNIKQQNKQYLCKIIIYIFVLTGCSTQNNEQFPRWTHFYIDQKLPGEGWGTGGPALADYDKDGDLDVAVSRRSTQSAYWYERINDSVWVQHLMGQSEKLARTLGTTPVDIDHDGWVDVVFQGVWFKNPGNLSDNPDAPCWDQYARGTMMGITGGTTRAHIVRATLEAIAFQVAENLEVMQKDSGISIDVMRVDGGAVVNQFLMQFQADILGIPVDVPVINETTALGAAYLAALGVGDFNSLDAISQNWKLHKRYLPSISEDKRKQLMEQWKKAVERSRNWAEF